MMVAIAFEPEFANLASSPSSSLPDNISEDLRVSAPDSTVHVPAATDI